MVRDVIDELGSISRTSEPKKIADCTRQGTNKMTTVRDVNCTDTHTFFCSLLMAKC